MHLTRSIFSFEGRMGRAAFGLCALCTLPLIYFGTVLFVGCLILVVIHVCPSEFGNEILRIAPNDPLMQLPIGLVATIAVTSFTTLILIAWAGSAAVVRRLHDMNLSGLLAIVPIHVAAIPYFVCQVCDWRAYVGFAAVTLVLTLWPGGETGDVEPLPA